jgi:glycosyltransferase involved in cell wall biosynthesis
VPHILLSARSTARPQLYIEPFLELQKVYAKAYRLLATCPHVPLSANSTGGAESYAEWTQIPLREFRVVPNCVSEEFTKPLPSCFTESKRLSLSLKEDQPFILGVFRLHPIKKPLDFVRVIGRLHEKYPDLRAAICGSMDFEVPEIRALIHELGLEDVLFLLGVASDIPALMQTATILLHTAQTEGSPNVVLEAQAMGARCRSGQCGRFLLPA